MNDNTDFLDCSKGCTAIEMLGAGECDSVCPSKFDISLDSCPLCHGTGEYHYGGSFGGNVHVRQCDCKIRYNHDRPLSDFQSSIDELKVNGYNPIAVSQLYFEDTFVFETSEEAKMAYYKFERDENELWIGKLSGWWYGKEDFTRTVEQYEADNDGYSKVLIHWLS